VKTATAKDLRNKTSLIIEEIRKGQPVTITYRNKPIAVLTPIDTKKPTALKATAFGIWKDRKDNRNVEKWLSKLRQPRFTR
jgi:prevent-host-death family protein